MGSGALNRWAAPAAIGLALIGGLVLAAAFSLWIGTSRGWAYDFHAYFDAAVRLSATGSPYQAETLSGPFRPGPYGLYLYAPPLAVLFLPLTAIDAAAAAIGWLVVHVVALVALCALMPVSRVLRVAVFGIAAISAPILFDLDLGNVSLFVTFFAVLVWRWLDRPIAGVALAASLAFRPTMGLIAGWWLLRGRWRPLVGLLIAGTLLVIATLPFVGIAGWFDYVTVLRHVSDTTGVYRNYDLSSAVLIITGSAGAASLALLAGYVLAVVAMLVSLRRDRELSYVVTLGATLLLSPLMWDHYLTTLLVPAAFLASRGRVWGLLLPLACWLPYLVGAVTGIDADVANAMLPFIALIAMVLPFAVEDRGERAGRLIWRRSAVMSAR